MSSFVVGTTLMMHGYGWGMGWGMGLFGLLGLIVLVLAIAALAKYLGTPTKG